jgi:hypothetical protein
MLINVNSIELPEYIKITDKYIESNKNILIDIKYCISYDIINNNEDFSNMVMQILYWECKGNLPKSFYHYMIYNFDYCFNLITSKDTELNEIIIKIVTSNNLNYLSEIKRYFPTIDISNFYKQIKIYNINMDKFTVEERVKKILISLVAFDNIFNTYFSGNITNEKCLCYLRFCSYVSHDINNSYFDFCNSDFLDFLESIKDLDEKYIMIYYNLDSYLSDISFEIFYDYKQNSDSNLILFGISCGTKRIKLASFETILKSNYDINYFLSSYRQFCDDLEEGIERETVNFFYHFRYNFNFKHDDYCLSFYGDKSVFVDFMVPYNIFNKNKILQELRNISRNSYF